MEKDENGLKVLHETIFDFTRTTEIIDEFTQFDKNGKRLYDRMILKRKRKGTIGLYYEEEKLLFPISYVIEFPKPRQEWFSDKLFDVTMSDIKEGRMGTFNRYVLETIPAEKMTKCRDRGTVAFLDKPFLLRAQI